MTEKKVLYLTFVDEAGKDASVTVANPKEGLDMAVVRPVGELLAQRKVLQGVNGNFAAFKGAKVVTTQTEELV